ncbi:hypothetical protein [Streptomyces lasiicapitis]|uniref:hypothetical protein n=1 Tax=Streptomyces lasiicapitis TaxID=1923961 RepID=UPI0036541A85
MPAPIPLSQDVVDYVREIFDDVNECVTARINRMPTVHEETLDFAFVDAVAQAQGPHLTPSGTIVDIDVHFLGGGRHWARWEVADIGFIVTFRRASTLIRTKVVLLQSKRLYPRESEFTEGEGMTRLGGFGSLMRPSLSAALGPRTFRFDETCRYKALQVGDEQWQAISKYEDQYGLPVHYMFYHPHSLPTKVSIPVVVPIATPPTSATIGTRVISSQSVRAMTSQFSRNYAPAFGELQDESGEVGIRLPRFVVDRVLSCFDGYVVDDGIENEGLQRVFNQRSAPIAAAVRLDINLAG